MSAKLASLGFKGRYGVNQPKEANKASGREEKKETNLQEEKIIRTKSSDAGRRLQLLDKTLRLLAIQVRCFFLPYFYFLKIIFHIFSKLPVIMPAPDIL